MIGNLFTEGSLFNFESNGEMLPSKLVSFYLLDTENVSQYSFAYTNLNTVGLSASVKSISEKAFYSCLFLTNIVWFNKDSDVTTTAALTSGDSITSIGNEAFNNCKKLAVIKLPDTITSLGTNVFYNCSSLTGIRYSSSLTTIPDYTFYSCSSLKDVSNFSSSITSIGNYAFYGCKSFHLTEDNDISSLSFANSSTVFKGFDYFTGLTSIGNNAFSNCAGIIPDYYKDDTVVPRKLRFPDTLTFIGSSAFSQDLTAPLTSKDQTEIIWGICGDSVTLETYYETAFTNLIIGSRAFYNLRCAWNNLNDDKTEGLLLSDTIFIPKIYSLGSDAYHAFNSDSIFDICLLENSESDNISKTFVNYTKKIIYDYEKITTISVVGGDNITRVGIYMLSSKDSASRMAYLKKITDTGNSNDARIPATVEYNSNSYSVKEVLTGALGIYDSITTLTFETGSVIEKLETAVLTTANSSYLSAIRVGNTNNIIPDTLSITTGNNLKSTTWYSAFSSGYVTIGKYIVGYIETDAEKSATYGIDMSATSYSTYSTIYDDAFTGNNCSTVIFNDNLKNINIEAFKDTKLDYSTTGSFVLPSSLETIGDSAFLGCKFRELNIPATVSSIGNSAFCENSNSIDHTGCLATVRFMPRTSAQTLSGTPFNVMTEISTGLTISPTRANVTLRNIYVPDSISWVLSTSFSQFKLLSQVTNIYLGNLENSGALCDNYPLYYSTSDTSSDKTTTVTAYPYTDSSGNQIYCYRFFYNMRANTSLANSFLETTDAKSVCPLGDIDGSTGYSANLDLTNIRKYSGYSSAISGATLPITADFTKEQLLMIFAGFTNSSTTTWTVKIHKSDYNNIRNYISMITSARKIKFEVVL